MYASAKSEGVVIRTMVIGLHVFGLAKLRLPFLAWNTELHPPELAQHGMACRVVFMSDGWSVVTLRWRGNPCECEYWSLTSPMRRFVTVRWSQGPRDGIGELAVCAEPSCYGDDSRYITHHTGGI